MTTQILNMTVVIITIASDFLVGTQLYDMPSFKGDACLKRTVSSFFSVCQGYCARRFFLNISKCGVFPCTLNFFTLCLKAKCAGRD